MTSIRQWILRDIVDQRASARREQAERQNCQHDQGDDDVHVVMFDGKCHGGKGHARHWRRNQQEQSKLNDRPRAYLEHPLNDVLRTFQALRFAVERAVAGNLVSMPRQVEYAADQNNGGSQNDSRAQQGPNDDLDPLIIPAAWLGGRQTFVAHNRPVAPLKIISNPSTTMTAANRYRSALTFALTNILAPIIDPASTPSITGMAMPGAT